MNTTLAKIFCAVLTGCFTSAALAQFPVDRSLIDAKGRKLDATILSEANDKIHILRKSDGKQFHIPMIKLSNADQRWLKELINPAASPVEGKPKEAQPQTPTPTPKPVRKLPKPRKVTQLEEPKPPKLISSEQVLAEQLDRGMVPPPDGRDALQTTVKFTDGREISGYVYDIKGGKFWYAAMDMIQKSALLSELKPHSHIAIENWKNRTESTASPLMAFMVNGKKIYASVLSANEVHARFLTEVGELMENVPLANLDEMGRNFIAEWNAGTWKPDKWEWVVSAEFTAVKRFSESGYAMVRKDGKWGVINTSGEFSEPARFDKIKEFSDSSNYKVRENGMWGLLGDDGKLILAATWEDVGDLHHGLIPVRSEGKWGYADESGEIVIPCKWDSAWRFSSVGTAVVTLAGKRGFVDRGGKVIVKPEWDGALMHTPEGIGAVRRGNGWALVDIDGKQLCDPEWVFDWSDRRFELGYIKAWPMSRLGNQSFSSWWRNRRGSLGMETFLGVDGKAGATPKLREGVCLPGPAESNTHAWEESKTFSQPHPLPKISKQKKKYGLIDSKQNKKYGVIDLAGKIVFKLEYDSVSFIDAETILLKNGRNGQISDVTGKVILEGDISYVKALKNGSGYEVNIGKKRKIYWKDWQPVLPKELEALTFVDGYGSDLIFRKGSKGAPKAWWRADFKTQKLHRIEGASRVYWVKSLADYERIWLEDAETKRWQFCKIDGTRLGLEMAEQPSAWFFDEGFGTMWEDAKCYFVNKDGKRLEFGLWDDSSVFKNGLAAVKKDGQWGFVDTKGTKVIDCKYDEVGNFFVASVDKDAKEPLLAAVCESGKWGYINEKGHLVIPLIGERQGRWEVGGIYIYTQEKGGVYYDAAGNKADINQALKAARDKRNAIKSASNWSITESSNGRIGLVGASGKFALEQEWHAIEWVAPDVVVARGAYTGGLFSTKKGWLFQDGDKYRIRRNQGYRNTDRLSLYGRRFGFLVIEETPKWGYARWKSLVAVDGLIAHYPLDGNTKDSSGIENHMVYNQTQWVEDKHGNPSSAIYLDGTEELVSSPLYIGRSVLPKVTLVAWARGDIGKGWRHLIGVCNGLSLEIMNGWSARGTGGKWGCFGHRKIKIGEWVFLAATYDQETRNVTLRVNEELFEGKMNNHCFSGSFRLGGAGGAKNFKGAFDEVRVYNRQLSKDELDGLYQQFLTGKKD